METMWRYSASTATVWMDLQQYGVKLMDDGQLSLENA